MLPHAGSEILLAQGVGMVVSIGAGHALTIAGECEVALDSEGKRGLPKCRLCGIVIMMMVMTVAIMGRVKVWNTVAMGMLVRMQVRMKIAAMMHDEMYRQAKCGAHDGQQLNYCQHTLHGGQDRRRHASESTTADCGLFAGQHGSLMLTRTAN